MQIQISDHFNYKKLIRFVLPSIFMIMFSSAYAIVDGLFISNFAGKTAFAAINIIVPVTTILGGIGFMFGKGGRALVAKAFGEGDNERGKRYFTMIIIVAIIFSVVVAAIGIGVMRPLAILLKASEDMLSSIMPSGVSVICSHAERIFTPFFFNVALLIALS